VPTRTVNLLSQLYDTSGTTEDWNYAAAGTLGYTIEMGPSGGGSGSWGIRK
jgi:hypothetical protein